MYKYLKEKRKNKFTSELKILLNLQFLDFIAVFTDKKL